VVRAGQQITGVRLNEQQRETDTMYGSFFGGSALLHILAAHPKVVAAFGIAATVAYLSNPFGTRDFLGAGTQVRHLAASVEGMTLQEELALERAAAAIERLDPASPATAAAVEHALRACGAGCAELTVDAVLNDPGLLKKTVYVAEIDRGADAARAQARASGGQISKR
jgi:hypothetical protein